MATPTSHGLLIIIPNYLLSHFRDLEISNTLFLAYFNFCVAVPVVPHRKSNQFYFAALQVVKKFNKAHPKRQKVSHLT